jgi:hypothetical protein
MKNYQLLNKIDNFCKLAQHVSYIDFPKTEYESLKKRLSKNKPIYTTRIKDEQNKYDLNDIVLSPFGYLKVSDIQTFSKIQDHPFYDNLSIDEKETIKDHIFDVLKLNKLWVVGNSNIHGEGIFDNVNLPKGVIIGLSFEKVLNTGVPDKDYKRTKLGALVNHSSNPNLILCKKNDKFYYNTLSKINKGDELTINYNDFPWEGKRDFE